MKKHAQHSIEILYIAGCENWIWADEGGVNEIDKLLGITPDSKRDIEHFFAGIGQPGVAVDN